MTSKVEIVNELGEYTTTTIRARNMPELYRKNSGILRNI